MIIYTLNDKFGNPRYVGQTKFNLEKRLVEHIRESKRVNHKLSTGERAKSTHKLNWLRSLNYIPFIEKIDEVKDDEADFWEIHYHNLYKSWGFNLVNDERFLGRASIRGRKHTKEAKENMAKAKRGKKLSDEHKANIGRANIGREVSEETRQKISISEIKTKNEIH